VIPGEVFSELTAPGAPPKVAAWIRTPPGWIEVPSVCIGPNLFREASESDLDAGEVAAIQIALAEDDSLSLIDEAAGRVVASRLGVANTGTLGVLNAAKGRCASRFVSSFVTISEALHSLSCS